ncbi:MAG: oligosaccharide flippase family protein [Oscillospiraceae bacterium]|nr:oligosaccharide flippase family protein [Oscillospiraceae bacterium]
MSEQNRDHKVLKAGLSYTVGNMLSKGLSFFSIFIFARLMTPADYGIYNTFGAYVSILAVVIGFALHTSIKNARMDYGERLDSYCSSVTILTLGNSALLLVVALLFSGPLSQLLSISRTLVILVVLESFATAMLSFYYDYLAINYLSREYLAVSLLYAIFGIGLSVVLVTTVFSGARYMGRVFGTLIPLLAVAVYALFRFYRKSRPTVNREFWKYGLKISLPIVPHGLSQLLLSQFDRIMIKKIIGDTESGLYSFSYNVGIIFQVITNSMDTAWTPWFFERMADEDYDTIRKKATNYVSFVSVLAAGLMLISPELISIMGGAQYSESRYVVLPIVLAMYYSFLYTIPSCVEYYYKKTNLIAAGTMLAAVSNIILNAIFIPRYGYVAAAYTTVFCYLLYFLIHVFLARSIHGSYLFDMRVLTFWLVVITVFSFICLALVDFMLIRMAILAAALLAALFLALRYRSELHAFLQGFKKKS